MILSGTRFLTSSQPCVRFCGVDKFYGDFQALHHIDLTIERGEKWVICGPSGSGKSTLIRTINGLEGIDDGQLFLFGEPVTPSYLRRLQGRVGMVFQQFNLFPHMTVLENLMVAPVHTLGLRPQEAKARALGLLERVRIQAQADKYPHQLSGGQQQRVAIARAVVNKPRLLLLDESLSALDYKLRKQMQSELKALQRRLGITFVFVTHDQEEALTMSDRILVMEGGKIIQRGTPRDIYESPANLFVARFIGEINVMDGKLISQREPGIWQAEVEGRECLLHTTLPFQPDDKVLVLLRPEDLRILDQDDDQSGALRGNIRERNYKGATLDSVIELESGKQLLISEFFDEDDPDFDYRLGQEVAIHWVDSWEVVLPYEPH